MSTSERDELDSLRAENARLRVELDRYSAQGGDGEGKYRALFESIDEGFCIVEFVDTPRGPLSDYVHLEANGAFRKHCGLPDSVGLSARDLIGDEAVNWIATYRLVLETRQPIHFELELTSTAKHLQVSAWPSGPSNGNQVAILFKDLTERRRAETALAQLNVTLEERIEERSAALRLYRDIVQSDHSPVFAYDADMRITAFNKAHADAYFRTYGIRQQVGDILPDQILPDQGELLRSSMARALAGESLIIREAFGHPDLEVPVWQIAFNPLLDDEGRIIGGFHHALDITAEVRAQEELERTQDALRQSQKMEAIGQLTGGVAHDFNNLLTVIRGSVDLLRRENVAPEKRQRYLDAIGDTAERAAKLTGQLLAFARRQTLEPETIDVRHRLDAVSDMLDSITGARVLVRYELPPEACLIRADVSQFETALVNLAVNARDAMDGVGTITVQLRCDAQMPAIRGHGAGTGRFVAVSLTDTGVGIVPDDLERIFEPFFTTKGVGKGTGLGLSQVFGFAKQSGGDVDVESVAGEGAIFTLYLPQVDTAEADSRPATLPQTVDGEGRCVLIVEDNIGVGQFASQLLDDLGFRTKWVTSAEEALEQLGTDGSGFDIVFSDVVMPGMGGIELARRLARDIPALPVILASGYSHVLATEGAEGMELLKKPYSAIQLSNALQRQLGEHRESTG
ncbi:hybrid sensor histidine kinase/response regulator [Sphingomonas mollis]|uniref:histidine kinase n=1 Tax=Sphingomonas mollis TaxID=2795726 RepID=A0ABS0XLF5_9SPHN|nr:ATP-binding protein [Sphingomonas sp. BT553]MBJ6120863.1 PAS domain-containing protein [Sphingomonas sp. BT553]